MPTLPLTQLDERGLAADLDNRTFSLTFAQPVPIKDLLLLLVRGTNVSIVPDPGVTGSFIGELKNVTVRQALGFKGWAFTPWQLFCALRRSSRVRRRCRRCP